MSIEHQHIENIEELNTSQKYQLSIHLGGRTPLGFYRYYFNDLEYHRTQTDCFNHVNELYFDLYGEYRYDSYDTFRKCYNRALTKNPYFEK